MFSTRQGGGDGFIVWGGMSKEGLTELYICDKPINSSYYCEILKSNLFPYAKEKFKKGFWFQQDNASSHKSKYTMNFLSENGIKTLDWPANSPDLNPIENLWGELVRKIYKNGSVQFPTKKALKKAVLKEWSAIDIKFCRKLINSMPKRCYSVIKKDGGVTDY